MGEPFYKSTRHPSFTISQPQPENIEMCAPNIGWNPLVFSAPPSKEPRPYGFQLQTDLKQKNYYGHWIKDYWFILGVIVTCVIIIIIVFTLHAPPTPTTISIPKSYTSYKFNMTAWQEKLDDIAKIQNHLNNS